MREELIRAHLNMREHLYRVIDGLTQEILMKEVSDEPKYPNMLSLIWHIGGAETYWFHRANHDIAPRFTIERFEDIQNKLRENTEGIKRVLRECDSKQIQIINPKEEGVPSVAWCLLRTYQHGLYHTAQISKMRHIIEGCPPISGNDETWESAVDSVIEIVKKLYNK
ncbi:MAG: DinB family protein [Candidatus Odinarchaeota archaeon]